MYFMFAEQLLRIVAGLLVGIWLARYLGPAQFGILNYVLAFVSILGVISGLGLEGISVRDLVRQTTGRYAYLGTLFWLKLLGCLLAILCIYLATQATNNDATTTAYILIIAFGLLFQSFEVIDFNFQSMDLAKITSICKIVQLISSSILKIYYLNTGGTLENFVVISLVDQVSLALSLLVAYRLQGLPNFLGHFDIALAAKLLKQGAIVVSLSFLHLLYIRIDQIMLNEMIGGEAVGLYVAATKLSEVWSVIPLVIINALYPSIVQAKLSEEAVYLARLQSLFSIVVWLAIPISITMFIAASPLIVFLYGHSYVSAGPVLAIHSMTSVFVFISLVAGKWYLTEGQFALAFFRTLSGAITNVTLNLVLIPVYGIVGAAIASLAAHVANGLVFDLMTAKTRFLFYMKLKSLDPRHLKKIFD
ncbi:flippase [Magnetovirga frankeli]|nr:flippase [gamma proteobacterium SS-5]